MPILRRSNIKALNALETRMQNLEDQYETIYKYSGPLAFEVGYDPDVMQTRKGKGSFALDVTVDDVGYLRIKDGFKENIIEQMHSVANDFLSNGVECNVAEIVQAIESRASGEVATGGEVPEKSAN